MGGAAGRLLLFSRNRCNLHVAKRAITAARGFLKFDTESEASGGITVINKGWRKGRL
jgi:hypothetical protein